jgi:hypothetical protein
VLLSDGTAQAFDLVVGADGIRSQLRERVTGPLAPRYTGFGVWRSVHERPRALVAKIMMMGIGKRLGIMPIADDRLYLFGTVAEPAGRWYPKEEWPARMRERFAEFGGPARPFLDQLGADSELLYTAVEEVQVPLPWACGAPPADRRRGPCLDAVHGAGWRDGGGGRGGAGPDAGRARHLGGHLARLRRAPLSDVPLRAGRLAPGWARAGAVEDAAGCALRNAAMREGAQRQVDAFYGQLDALRAG